jgi:hypothetical protein
LPLECGRERQIGGQQQLQLRTDSGGSHIVTLWSLGLLDDRGYLDYRGLLDGLGDHWLLDDHRLLGGSLRDRDRFLCHWLLDDHRLLDGRDYLRDHGLLGGSLRDRDCFLCHRLLDDRDYLGDRGRLGSIGHPVLTEGPNGCQRVVPAALIERLA